MRSRPYMLVVGAILPMTAGMVPLARRSASAPDLRGAALASVVAMAPLGRAAATSGAAKGVSSGEAQVDSAVDALSAKADHLSDPAALRTAFQAYYAFQAAHPERVRNPYFYFVDYGLDSRTARGYVFDMASRQLVDGPFTVAHGRGSSTGQYGVPTRFSNASGSMASSLGLFVAGERYGFTGRSGGRRYGSVGMRLDGVSGRFNDEAGPRGVVVHGAPYVTRAGAGRSEGCPAMEPARARRLIPLLADGGMVFIFSPRDTAWMHQDPWANLPAGDSSAAPPIAD